MDKMDYRHRSEEESTFNNTWIGWLNCTALGVLLEVDRDGDDWMMRACDVLALAVVDWLGPEGAKIVKVNRWQEGKMVATEHYAVRVGAWYLDGNGVASKAEILQEVEETLEEYEGYDGGELKCVAMKAKEMAEWRNADNRGGWGRKHSSTELLKLIEGKFDKSKLWFVESLEKPTVAETAPAMEL